MGSDEVEELSGRAKETHMVRDVGLHLGHIHDVANHTLKHLPATGREKCKTNFFMMTDSMQVYIIQSIYMRYKKKYTDKNLPIL